MPDTACQDPETALNQRLVASFNALSRGVTVWSQEERLQFANEPSQALLSGHDVTLRPGMELHEFMQKLSSSGLVVLHRSQGEWVDQELAAHRNNQTSEYTLSDGSIHQVERTALPGGGTVALTSDVTEIRRNERAIRKAREEAELSDKTKSRFLRAANHDLRQPLASLKILIYNCLVSDDEEHKAHLLHAMDVSVSIMEDLLGALLNIGQLDAGQITPKIRTFQMYSLLERLEIEFAHQARDKGLDFRVVKTRLAVVSDRVLLERIVGNFVANAIRYTNTGGIVVGCRRSAGGLRLEVRDSGRGIAPEHQEAIFGEFFKISDNQQKYQHSLGLGLNIAKRIADILKHRISVRSEPGRGSIFSIDLPLGDILHSDIGEPEISERIGGEFMDLSVLVLEDDKNLRDALLELLERWGIVTTALNTDEELAVYYEQRQSDPDLIIADFRLRGGVLGTQLVRQIRQRIEKTVPAVVVTADTDPGLIDGIRSEGFPVLIKPVSPPRLRVMMHNILYEPELVEELSVSDDDSTAATV